ncbi:tetratricopeptide repeat protein [Oceanihabitans sediminis]|uniref:Tetratricopeptide repeat protein n=1 Tax=Oceanihabitans sediminis TaxID=1812012 RepID=A0A368P915_9FLAO|nr:tetratricopeptide repeat protein [Oceanihabitans sediminis]RBP34633.1 tetratricopeptide repeat protein [Oceanihabitans sediminis]RCU58289.1 tetratricopeptide repeat protein [Oceanihabitans sediminis]
MKKQLYILFFVFGIFLFPQVNYAQVDFNKKPEDDLGDVSDAYQELFFEALKQKGIENYDRAVEALLKCEKLDDSDPALYFELGKNYNKLKDFGLAEEALKKAVKKEPDNEWFLDELYVTYSKLNETDKAIQTVKQLVKYHPDYKEDLVTLYVKSRNFEEALKVLDEIDAEKGVSAERDRVRNRIYHITGNKKEQIENLEERVADNPDEEKNYLSLIYRYSENNEKQKAFETAKKLLESHPNSQLVHLALYKFYLDNKEADKAVSSMEIVLNSTQIKPEAKMMVLSDFVKFVGENPEYESQLVEITSKVTEDEKGKSSIELAQYFLAKGEKQKALDYYKQALQKEPDNFGVLRNVMLLYLEVENYTEAEKMSSEALGNYPSQPIFYLVNAVAQNNLNQPQKAIRNLEAGLDYIIEDTNMEIDFYKQLSIAYTQLNNTSKAKSFIDKVKQLELKN